MKSTGHLFAAAVLAFLAGCGRPSGAEGAAAAEGPAVRVRVVAAKAESSPALTPLTGVVRPVDRAQLAAKVMGSVEEIPVTLGQAVGRGDVLVRIGAAEIGARVAQARSQANQAGRDLAREKELLPKGASTAEMVSNLEDRYAASLAALHEAEVMQGNAVIRAPFDGVVSRKFVNAGDLASPGMPLLEIEGRAGFEVEAGVPDSLAQGLSVGGELSGVVPVGNLSFRGRIAELSPAADAGSHTVAVKVRVPDGVPVRSGDFARLEVPGAPERGLFVPAAAVSTLGQMERVFVVGDGNRAVLRLVKTGVQRGDRVEILSGVDEAERVVVAPPAGLGEGQALEILP